LLALCLYDCLYLFVCKKLTLEVGTSILDTPHIIIPVTRSISYFLPKFLFHIPKGIIILIGQNSLRLLWNWGCRWKRFWHFKLIFILLSTLRTGIIISHWKQEINSDITVSLTRISSRNLQCNFCGKL